MPTKRKCNTPRRNTRGSRKKFSVLGCENGKEKTIQFGDPNMEIRRDNAKARNSFRARHKCGEKKSKLTAGYWSCFQWRSNSKVKG